MDPPVSQGGITCIAGWPVLYQDMIIFGYGTAGACNDTLTDCLAQKVAQELLPLVPELLREEKPIPVWALKVVEECLESLPDTTIPTLERCTPFGLWLSACLAQKYIVCQSPKIP